MNITDTVILLDIAMIALATDKIIEQQQLDIFTTLYFIAASILLGLSGYLIYKIFQILRKRIILHRKTSHSVESRNTEVAEQENLRSGEYYELPDRILHPEEYEEYEVTTVNN